MSRTVNPLRAAAKEAGEKFYTDALPCDLCGATERYTVNGACTNCARRKGSARYHALDDAGRERQKQKDKDRHERRKRARASALADELDELLR